MEQFYTAVRTNFNSIINEVLYLTQPLITIKLDGKEVDIPAPHRVGDLVLKLLEVRASSSMLDMDVIIGENKSLFSYNLNVSCDCSEESEIIIDGDSHPYEFRVEHFNNENDCFRSKYNYDLAEFMFQELGYKR